MSNPTTNNSIGFISHIRSATNDDWRQVGTLTALTLLGIIITIWLPELFLSYLGKDFQLNRAAIDGRLSTQGMANLFTIIATAMIVPKPTRRQTYPLLWAALLILAVLFIIAITTHIPDVRYMGQAPSDRMAINTAWIGTIITVTIGAFIFAARLGEEQILKSQEPRAMSTRQEDDYLQRVKDANV